MIEFRTHTGEIATGQQLQVALNKVADDLTDWSLRIRQEDGYAKHVTDNQKEDNLHAALAGAASIREGNITSFTIWQRVNQALTGESIPFLK